MEVQTQSKKHEIQTLKDEYFQQNTKNTIFKKSQKFECAQYICQNMGLEDLIYHTAWIIPNTNKVYIDYLTLKTYANPDNFDAIVEKMMLLCLECSNNFVKFEVHLNIDSLTVSAIDRYKGIIELFCNRCFHEGTFFTQSMTSFCLYNIPTSIDTIAKLAMPLIPPEVRAKFVLYKKDVSPQLLTSLHSPS